MMKKLLVIWIAAIFALTLGAAAPAQEKAPKSDEPAPAGQPRGFKAAGD